MTRSDSSDSGRSRKHKKKSKHRSRSDSSSSEERSRKSRKHKSDRRKDDHRRSRSRERRRSRSRDRKRSRTRSRERKKSRSRSRSRSRERKKSRSRSRSKSPFCVLQYVSGWDETSKPPNSRDSKQSQPKSRGSDMDGTDDKLSLKEKIKLLTAKTDQTETITPGLEQLDKIESDNFIQEKFSSTYIDPSAQPKQKKKKKNKQKQAAKINEELVNDVKVEQQQHVEPVSHEDAMFGNTMDTLHVTRFATGIDVKRKDLLKTVETDSIFGAMFFDDPEVRMKRWINKLTNIRRKLLEEGE